MTSNRELCPLCDGELEGITHFRKGYFKKVGNHTARCNYYICHKCERNWVSDK